MNRACWMVSLASMLLLRVPPMPTTQPMPSSWLRTQEHGNTLVYLVYQTDGETFRDHTIIWKRDWPVMVPVWNWKLQYCTEDGEIVVLIQQEESLHYTAWKTERVDDLYNDYLNAFNRCDFDRDGDVDMTDFGVLQVHLGEVGPSLYDVTGDLRVNRLDVYEFSIQATGARK